MTSLKKQKKFDLLSEIESIATSVVYENAEVLTVKKIRNVFGYKDSGSDVKNGGI